MWKISVWEPGQPVPFRVGNTDRDGTMVWFSTEQLHMFSYKFIARSNNIWRQWLDMGHSQLVVHQLLSRNLMEFCNLPIEVYIAFRIAKPGILNMWNYLVQILLDAQETRHCHLQSPLHCWNLARLMCRHIPSWSKLGELQVSSNDKIARFP